MRCHVARLEHARCHARHRRDRLSRVDWIHRVEQIERVEEGARARKGVGLHTHIVAIERVGMRQIRKKCEVVLLLQLLLSVLEQVQVVAEAARQGNGGQHRHRRTQGVNERLGMHYHRVVDEVSRLSVQLLLMLLRVPHRSRPAILRRLTLITIRARRQYAIIARARSLVLTAIITGRWAHRGVRT